jgi:class 3 adenylate cyclase
LRRHREYGKPHGAFGAAPSRIHVSGETYSVLRDDFAFESRGQLEIKGKGSMETYFLLGRAVNFDRRVK